MEHVLDNPAWNALISGNKHLAFGDGDIRYFDSEVSPFAAFRENTEKNFSRLFDELPGGRKVLFVSPVDIEIPGRWQVLRKIHGVQMVCNEPGESITVGTGHQALKSENVLQMLELARLTQPGPFDNRTIDFGHYQGIVEDNQLVAMAGQRLHAENYTEVSAVCTRPGYTGKGYARQLILNQLVRMRAAGNIPYLHSRADNERAIKLYESLGFKTRREVWFYFMLRG